MRFVRALPCRAMPAIHRRCHVAHKATDLSLAQSQIVIFHGDKDPYFAQVDDIIGCLQAKETLALTTYVVAGCGHGDLPMCMARLPEQTCMVETVQEWIAR
jgi:hypothetical protein